MIRDLAHILYVNRESLIHRSCDVVSSSGLNFKRWTLIFSFDSRPCYQRCALPQTQSQLPSLSSSVDMIPAVLRSTLHGNLRLLQAVKDIRLVPICHIAWVFCSSYGPDGCSFLSFPVPRPSSSDLVPVPQVPFHICCSPF